MQPSGRYRVGHGDWSNIPVSVDSLWFGLQRRRVVVEDGGFEIH